MKSYLFNCSLFYWKVRVTCQYNEWTVAQSEFLFHPCELHRLYCVIRCRILSSQSVILVFFPRPFLPTSSYSPLYPTLIANSTTISLPHHLLTIWSPSHSPIIFSLSHYTVTEPTDDSVEIAVNFVKEVGQLLEELSPQGLHAIFERFRGILHEGDIDKRVQYTIEGMM